MRILDGCATLERLTDRRERVRIVLIPERRLAPTGAARLNLPQDPIFRCEPDGRGPIYVSSQ